MERRKLSSGIPAPRPGGSWLAGAMIGGAIASIAASAMLLGTGAAIQAVIHAARPRPKG